jgi:hypothetical protein
MPQTIATLIAAVATATTHRELSDAYLAARRPCRDADAMRALLDAHDAAMARIGEVEMVPLVKFG